jgi:4'-phosphopantetheinyl transferase
MRIPSPGVVHVWTIALDVPNATRTAELLSADERQRANAFRADRDRRRYIAAHAALRTILSDYVGTPPGTLRFGFGAWGKPFLDAPSAPCFNLTHSGELALVAVTQREAVGVDVEQIVPIADRLHVARSYFSRRECIELEAWPPQDGDRGFLRCWTRKEAVIKATGRGLALPLDRVDLPIGPDNASVLVHVDGEGEHAIGVRSFTPVGGYVAAIALYGVVEALHQMRMP